MTPTSQQPVSPVTGRIPRPATTVAAPTPRAGSGTEAKPDTASTILPRLVAVLSLQRRVRLAAKGEVLFSIVNETAQAFPYRQAAVWQKGRVVAASGAERAEKGAPYLRWLGRVVGHLAPLAARTVEPTPGVVEARAGDLPEALRGEWAEWLPSHAMVGDLGSNRALLVARDTGFQPWEREAFSALCGSYGQSLDAQFRMDVRRHLPGIRPSLLWASALVGLCVLGALPIAETALAPAEAVAEAPSFVRSPHQGVVARVLVSPNQEVRAGQPVAELDAAQASAQVEVSSRTLEAARAELLQATQEALSDPRARARLPVLRARVDEAAADLEWQRTRLDRSTLTAPSDGVAVFDDPSSLTGKPVETGERIMLVAPPRTRRIEVHLPLGDALLGTLGNGVQFFPDADPLQPIGGRIDFAAHAAVAQPDGTMAYPLRFTAEGADTRLGARGTAKVTGGQRPLILWILRKPIAAVRQWMAF